MKAIITIGILITCLHGYAQKAKETLQPVAGTKRFPIGLTLKGYYTGSRFYTLNRACLTHLRRNVIPLKDTAEMYYTDDWDKSLHYYSITPKGSIKGTIALLPSSGETTESVISNNKVLLEQCFNNHILSMILSINNDNGLDDDVFALRFLNAAFTDVVARFKVPQDKFVIGGLSNGGMLSLRYTELSREKPESTRIIPLAVYGADPPVDLGDLYNTSVRKIQENKDRKPLDAGREAGLNEARMLMDYYEKLTGGTPENVPEQYNRRSMFARRLPGGGNARFLTRVPVRIYCDPDVVWAIKNRDRSFYDMNAANLSALIVFLKLKGNQDAEFVSSLGLGHRLDGTRHPHSWSVIQPNDCIIWLKKLFKINSMKAFR